MSGISDSGLRDFDHAITWRPGGQYEFLLYAVRARHLSPFHGVELAAWPDGTTVKGFRLEDDPWPMVIDMVELHSPTLPGNMEQLLLAALTDAIDQGATIAWLMYEGAFGDVRSLFGPWELAQTYGIATPAQSPQLCIDPTRRSEPDWRRRVQAASDLLYQTYPSLKDST